ncbi:MAG: hypothetical protein ABJL67_15345 [Sulfitobacter sp.]
MVKRSAFEGGFTMPFEPPFEKAEHIRQHRPGRPSKIDTDAELHAFVVARIDTTTFEALAAQIAEHFPPERRVGKSTIHAWWQRQPNRHG